MKNPLGRTSLPLYKKEKTAQPTENSKPTDSWVKRAVQWVTLIGVVAFISLYAHIKTQTCVFNYTQIPTDFRNLGFTEEFITKTVNDLMVRVIRFESNLRLIDLAARTTGDATRAVRPEGNYSAMSSMEVGTIDNMTIEGIPFRTVITLTDKLLSPLNLPLDNNVSLEFFVNRDSVVSLAVHYKGFRKITSRRFTRSSLDQTIHLLCLDAAFLLLEKADPLALARYYLADGAYHQAAVMSQQALDNETDSERLSMAYYYLAEANYQLSDSYLDSALMRTDPTYLKLYKQALEKNPGNFYAHEFMMRYTATSDSLYEKQLSDLMEDNADNIYLISRFIKHHLSKVKRDVIRKDSARVNDIYRLITRTYTRPWLGNHNAFPSKFFYDIGQTLQQWGEYDYRFYDSAISLYTKAIEVEQQMTPTNLEHLSEFNNAVAYAFELKAFVMLESSNHCLEKMDVKAMRDSIIEDSTNNVFNCLQRIHQHAHVAVLYDSLNSWAWSTLGEYYGLMIILEVTEEHEDFIDPAFNAFSKAYKYGFDVTRSNYLRTEPYCTLSKRFPDRYSQLSKQPTFFSGEYAILRKLKRANM